MEGLQPLLQLKEKTLSFLESRAFYFIKYLFYYCQIVAGEEANVPEAAEGLAVEMLTVDCRVRYQRKKQEEVQALLEKYQPQDHKEGLLENYKPVYKMALL